MANQPIDCDRGKKRNFSEKDLPRVSAKAHKRQKSAHIFLHLPTSIHGFQEFQQRKSSLSWPNTVIEVIKVFQDFLLGFLFGASKLCDFLSKFQDSRKMLICERLDIDSGFQSAMLDMYEIYMLFQHTPHKAGFSFASTVYRILEQLGLGSTFLFFLFLGGGRRGRKILGNIRLLMVLRGGQYFKMKYGQKLIHACFALE